jgi:hypothetical protein
MRTGGAVKVERLSTDKPTNEDGTIDHILVATRRAAATAPRAASYLTVWSSATDDDEVHTSDHLMVKALLERTA